MVYKIIPTNIIMKALFWLIHLKCYSEIAVTVMIKMYATQSYQIYTRFKKC